ncbi:MAG TPA: NAD-dependent epimerase/dehydratase family protein [Streptosporangiaceae bacterium]|nr:NAD-dependent epimerase/dehydratase family protein [Streptosporangiaceae bacterium]
MSAVRAVVTGGCGFIGSHLVSALLARGAEVTVFDAAVPDATVPYGPAGNTADVRYVAGDVRDPDRVAEAVTAGTEVVYHLAAVVGVDRYLARPLEVIDVNFSGTRHVLDRAARTGARVVVASTSEVFGKHPDVPWREDGDRLLGPTTAHRWAYASSKGLAEHLTFAFVSQHGLDATVVRYFNVYGPRQRPAYLVSRTVHRVLNGLPPVLYDQGGHTRCFTYVGDAVEGTLLAAASPAATGEAFNLGSTRETTVASVVCLITKLADAAIPAQPVDTATALGASYQDLARRVPDTTKAHQRLGFQCRVPLEQGLAGTIKWARANPWWLALPDSGAA